MANLYRVRYRDDFGHVQYHSTYNSKLRAKMIAKHLAGCPFTSDVTIEVFKREQTIKVGK